jgi:hypothetical protein
MCVGAVKAEVDAFIQAKSMAMSRAELKFAVELHSRYGWTWAKIQPIQTKRYSAVG